MARTESDRTRAIEAASELFRTRGYERASIDDVVKATGFNRYALYQEFGGKRELLIAALDQFHADTLADLDQRLAEPGARAMRALQEFFDSPLEVDDDESCAAGSLMCQVAVEVAPKDPELHRHLLMMLGEKRRVVINALSRARREGDLRRDIEPEAAAALIMCAMFGTVAQTYAGFPRSGITDGLAAVFHVLSATPSADVSRS